MSAIASIYVALILRGKRTYSSVPTRLKAEVKQALTDIEREDLIDED